MNHSRETETETERDRERDRDRDRDRETERETDRDRQRQTERDPPTYVGPTIDSVSKIYRVTLRNRVCPILCHTGKERTVFWVVC